jgi:hypothetical protein
MRCNDPIAVSLPRGVSVSPATEPSIADKLSRLLGRPIAPRMRRPSALPTIVIVPTRSTYLQRLRWLFSGS